VTRIRVLPPELASQIAAGEVVERPASVVKELIENSLDAGARRIDVKIEGGGLGLIEVSDDGSGMSAEDARLSIERHATSKLRRFTDLDELTSYGFRGEALPSIASVSRFRLCTRPADQDGATELVSEGGAEPTLRPAPSPVGTTITVSDLFFNVPARRKFLRSSGTESGHVGDVVLDAALARPDVSFSLSREGRPVRSWPRTEDRRERTLQLFPDEELFVCEGERGPLRVYGLLSRPERSRQGAAGLKVLVNGRPIRDRALAGTVAHAYGSVLERGRYPRGVLYLELPCRLVDVNVHPQKTEVRFADPRAVTDAVHGIVTRELGRVLGAAPSAARDVRPSWMDRPSFAKRAVEAAGSEEARPALMTPPTRPVALRSPTSDAKPSPGALPSAPAWGSTTPGAQPSFQDPTLSFAAGAAEAGARSAPAVSSESAPRVPAETAPLLVRDAGATALTTTSSGSTWKRLRFLTQVRQTYLVCEGAEGLYVLDQHAAAERVVFSKLRRQFESREVASQALLFPLTVEVTPRESEVLAEHAEQIAAVGLDVRVRTPEVVSLHAVPRLLQRASPERMLRDLLSEVTRSGERAFSDAIDKALATMACHAAVRAGDPLSADEASALLAALDSADFAGYCPHGRPIVTFTSWEELERKVGRR
jgi:DNA mismatch repair protein MutL